MFSFNDLKIIKDSNRENSIYSFIGIQKNTDEDGYEFWLPHGFDNFSDTKFNTIKNFFFSFYKTLKTYESNSDNIQKKQRDGIITSDEGRKIDVVNEDNPVYFSKITMIDSIIDVYDDLKIFSLVNQQIISENIDYSKLPDYLHKAVYMQNNIIYVDKMLLDTKQVKFDSSDIVSLYTYIFCEIKNELDEFEDLPSDIKYIAENFKFKYLNFEVTLFDENDFEDTIYELKNILEDIKINTVYKDHDFWLYSDAIEQFLYGELGNTDSDFSYWGTNMFWYIWEDMCAFYNVFNYKEKIVYADSTRISSETILDNLANYDVDLDAEYTSIPFIITHKSNLNDNNKLLKRNIRPDMLLYLDKNTQSERYFSHVCNPEIINEYGRQIDINFHRGFDHGRSYDAVIIAMYKANPGVRARSPKLNTHSFKHVNKKAYTKLRNQFISKADFKTELQIIDFKYQSINDYNGIELSKKVKTDLVKQLVYEKVCQDIFGEDTEYDNMFLIPWYFESVEADTDFQVEKLSKLNKSFEDLDVKLCKANFIKIQDTYNRHGKLLQT